jgi:hypothetical protein
MMKNFRWPFISILTAFLLIEILSFAAWLNPAINQLAVIILVIATLIISLSNLEYGVLILLGELFIGSMGHLFNMPIGDYQVPVRIALWLVVMAVFAIQFLSQIWKFKSASPYWQSLRNFPGRKIFNWLFLFIFIGLVNGLTRHHNLSILSADFNAWLYFLSILPLIAVYGDRDAEKMARLKMIFLASAIWLSLKTLFLVFIFAHNYGLAPDIYNWLRQTLVGEMTPTVTGWPRVFIQGQIFSAIAFILVLWRQASGDKLSKFWQRQNLFSLILGALFLSSVLLSFSRSFWVGLAAAILFSFILIWRHDNFKKMLAALFWTLAAGICSVVMIYLVVAFPYWQFKTADFGTSFLARADSGNDAALTSRWSLWPALIEGIKQEPILGQGFGSTITYTSSDPRVLQNNPTGTYTTYAFEWGYLGLWLKIGLLGLLVYVLFLWQLISASLKIAWKTKDYLFFSLPVGIVFLAATNAFTPYLNHPLGIGYLVLCSCLIWPNRVY